MEKEIEKVCKFWYHRMDSLLKKAIISKREHNSRINLINQIEKELKEKLKEKR